MRIVIIGDGRVAHKIAVQLAEEDYDIVLIEYVFDKDGLHATIDLNGEVIIRTDIEQIRRYYWEGKEV